ITEDPDLVLDFGDAPDGLGGSYNTVLANNGAFHVLDGQTFLGVDIDAEPNGQPNLLATGDDMAGPSADDEDGIKFLTPLVAGQFTDIEVTANVDGFLNTWVDFNGNGLWDAAEQVHSALFVPAGVSVHSFFVPNAAASGQSYARFRFTDFQSPIGPAGSGVAGIMLRGEVEDYVVGIETDPDDGLDWGDAPDGPLLPGAYNTLAANNGAYHRIDGITYLGNEIDSEFDGQPDLVALGDDLNGPALDDEDGIKFLTPLVPGQFADVEVNASVDGFLNAWVDFSGNGLWDAGEQIFAGMPVPAGNSVHSFMVPAASSPGQTFSRFRFTNVQTPLGPAGSGTPLATPIPGEVEDYEVFINEIDRQLDFGDAPESPNGPHFYPTTAANNGAFHVIDGVHFMGLDVDPELDGQPNLAAEGDDVAGPGVDDEDGVKFLTPIVPGSSARVQVDVNADGFLSSWMDFNRNGVWDHPSEQIFSVQFLSAGSHLLSFNVPATADPGGTYSRWRFTDVQTPLVPWGSGVSFGAINGEVEDYRNKIVGKGDLDGDGDYTCNDIDMLVAEIASGANNPAFDLNGDLLVNTADRDVWLAEAGSNNLLSQNAYLLGDANLDGAVDGTDFVIWNSNKFTAQAAWCQGDFTANGVIDGGDFIAWNTNKFMNVGPITAGTPGVDTGFDLGGGPLSNGQPPQTPQSSSTNLSSYSTKSRSDEEMSQRGMRDHAVDSIFAEGEEEADWMFV
ncbi:MAG: GEVED domain-containing protein, partial [Planctomycetota bacterium]